MLIVRKDLCSATWITIIIVLITILMLLLFQILGSVTLIALA